MDFQLVLSGLYVLFMCIFVAEYWANFSNYSSLPWRVAWAAVRAILWMWVIGIGYLLMEACLYIWGWYVSG